MKVHLHILPLLLLIVPLHLHSQNHAHIFIANGATPQAASTSWTRVSGFSTSSAVGVAASPNGLTITQSATYLVQASCSFTGGSSGQWSVGLSVDGNAPVFFSKRSISNVTDVGNVTLTALLALSNSQSVTLVVQAPTSTTIIPLHAQLVAVNLEDISNHDGYAMLSAGTPASTTVASQSVSPFNGFTSAQFSNGWSVANGQLTADTTAVGTYLVIFSMSYSGSNNTDFDGGISLGNGPEDAFLCSRKLQSSSDIGNMTTAGILKVFSNTTITPVVRNNENASRTCDLQRGTVTLVKISGAGALSEATSHSSMAIVGAASQGSLGSGVPVTVTGFNDYHMDPSRWNFNASTLSPVGVSAGVYLVSYFVSFNSSAISSITYDLRLGGIAQSGLSTLRSTSSGGVTDNGAVGGCGIITVSSPTDIVSFALTDGGSSAPTLTINSACVALTRIVQTSTSVLPVELTSFSAHKGSDFVDLRWRTTTEIHNLGFVIERKSDTEAWRAIGFVAGAGQSATERRYFFRDEQLPQGQILQYRLRQRDRDGTESLSSELRVERRAAPSALTFQLYPNPVRSTAVLQVALDWETRLRVEVYDLSGRRHLQLMDSMLGAGEHAVSVDAAQLPPGVYVLHARTESTSRSLVFTRF